MSGKPTELPWDIEADEYLNPPQWDIDMDKPAEKVKKKPDYTFYVMGKSAAKWLMNELGEKK